MTISVAWTLCDLSHARELYKAALLSAVDLGKFT